MGYWGDFIIFDGFFADFKDAEDAYNVMMVVVCVACAGMAAGLTVGLLSLDETKLEIKVMIGTDEEKAAAEAILPIIKQHHLLLVTLLLFNSVANETLPIFLGTLVPNYMAIILAVTLILFFGEIIPTALFTGANQLLVAAKLTKLVYFLLILFYPIAFPIAKILDYFIDEEDDGAISREELEALVVLQGADHQYRRLSRENSIMTPQTPITDRSRHNTTNYSSMDDSRRSQTPSVATDDGRDIELGNVSAKSDVKSTTEPSSKQEKLSLLSRYEVNLMTGILKLAKFTVKDAMIPMRKVFMISSSTKLDEKSMYDILDSGFSRIPVFKRRDKQWILGYMLVKELIVLNPMDAVMIEDLSLREPICVKPTLGLMDMLRSFQEGRCHFSLVSMDPIRTLECIRNDERPSGASVPLGIVTMEDILEMIIQSEIVDETDSIHTNAYLGKTTGDSHKGSSTQPTIFYHSLRRNSHSNLSNASGSYSGFNKTSKGGIRIQQQSLRSKQKQASQVHYRHTNANTVNNYNNNNKTILKRPSATKMSSVVEGEVPNQGRMVFEGGPHMPSSRKRSISGATQQQLTSPLAFSTLNSNNNASSNNLTREKSSGNFFTDLTSKFMNTLMQEENISDIYARTSVERPSVIHVNKELQGLILQNISHNNTNNNSTNNITTNFSNNSTKSHKYSTNNHNAASEEKDEEEEDIVRLVGRDRDSVDSAYGFFDLDTGNMRRLSNKSISSNGNNNNNYNNDSSLSNNYDNNINSSNKNDVGEIKTSKKSKKSKKSTSSSGLPTVNEISSSLNPPSMLLSGIAVKEQQPPPQEEENTNEFTSLLDANFNTNNNNSNSTSTRSSKIRTKQFADSLTSNDDTMPLLDSTERDTITTVSRTSAKSNNNNNNNMNDNKSNNDNIRVTSIAPFSNPSSPAKDNTNSNNNHSTTSNVQGKLLIRDWDSFTY